MKNNMCCSNKDKKIKKIGECLVDKLSKSKNVCLNFSANFEIIDLLVP